MSKRKTRPTPPVAPAAPKKRIRPSRSKAAQGQPKDADVHVRVFRVPMPSLLPDGFREQFEELNDRKERWKRNAM